MSGILKALFYLKKGKRTNEDFLPVYVRITVDKQRAEWSTGKQCDSTKWNRPLGRMAGTKEEVKKFNAFLDSIEANIFEAQRDFTLRNELFTAEQIRLKVLHEDVQERHTLLEVYRHHNEQFGQLVGKEYSLGSFKKFKTALNSIEKFISWKYKRSDVFLEEVNHQFITDYEFYLKSKQKLQHNSAMSNMKKLKKIIRQCVANDWLEKDPFKSYKITTRETHRNYLLKEQLEALINREINVARLDQVRDLFVFSCYTGLSYSDVIKLTRNDIGIGIDNERWIFTQRIKTKTTSRIPILPVAQNIINKYVNHPEVANKNKLLPSISNQRLNSYLKELADMCGFNMQLTFHCARHTFATTVTLGNGVPIESVSKMLGHKNWRTTQLYAKLLDNRVSEDMQALKQKLAKAK